MYSRKHLLCLSCDFNVRRRNVKVMIEVFFLFKLPPTFFLHVMIGCISKADAVFLVSNYKDWFSNCLIKCHHWNDVGGQKKAL